MEDDKIRSKISEAIEFYIKQYCPENGTITLKAGNIRKRPVLQSIFNSTNHYAKDICSAMDKVTYPHEALDDKIESTAHEIKFCNISSK